MCDSMADRSLTGRVLVQFGNQTTGALVINNYAAQIFSRLNITGGTPLLLIGFYNLCTVPGNLCNGLFIDRYVVDAMSWILCSKSWLTFAGLGEESSF